MPEITDDELARLKDYERIVEMEQEGFGEPSEMDLVLTDARLLNQMAPPDRQVVTPPAFAPQPMDGILPPGPSPEFLRRSASMGRIEDDRMPMAPPGYGRGAIESFDPATGKREQFMSVSPPVSRQQQQYDAMERLREQANTMRYKNALDAKNAAMTFMATQEYQNAMNRGEDPRTAAAVYGRFMFGQNPNVVPNLMREASPDRAPSVEVDPRTGVTYFRHGRAGTTATAVPRTALPEQTMKPEVMEVEGERVIRLGPNRWQYLGKNLDTKELPPSVEASIYKFTIDKASKALDLIPSKKTEERQALQQQIQEAADNLMGMVKRKPSAPTPAPNPTAKTGPFATEQEARGAGHVAGDIVVLQINGKPTRVRLK